MIQVETTFTLQKFDTYERLDEIVNKFCRTHEIISVTPFNHKCDKCKGDIGYQIIYKTNE